MNVGPFSRSVSPQLGGDKSTATEAGLVAKVKFCKEVSASRCDDRGLSTTAAVRSAVGTYVTDAVALIHSPLSKVISLMRSPSADETISAQYVGPCGSTNTKSRVFCSTSPSRHMGRSSTRRVESRSARETVALRLLSGHAMGFRSGTRVTISSSGAIHRVTEVLGSRVSVSPACPAHESASHLSVCGCTPIAAEMICNVKSRSETDMT